MFTSDPNAFEVVLRNDGKYPTRFKELEDDMSKLILKAGSEPSLVNM